MCMYVCMHAYVYIAATAFHQIKLMPTTITDQFAE